MRDAGFAYIPETADNVDGRLNSAIVDALTIDDRKAWHEAYSGGDAHPGVGCYEWSLDKVFVLNAFPELDAAFAAILSDPRVKVAAATYDSCVARFPLDDPTSAIDPRIETECMQPFEMVRDTVRREVALAFLDTHYAAVRAFGEFGATL